MRAVYYERKGPASRVLVLGELPDPQPGPGEVRVKLHFSGINPTDTKLRGGWDGSMEMPFPRVIPHQDGAGVIDAVGPGVPRSRIGERVWIYEAQRGRAFGTAAGFVAIPSENAVTLPESASFETGACLGIAGMTAHRCLFQDGGIQGQAVLVAGGAGAVGHAAIQLAKWGGARVATTVSRPAARIGAFTRGLGVDRVVEVAFEANLELNRAVLKANGVISTYSSGPPDSAPRIPFTAIMRQGISVHFILVYVMPREAHQSAARDLNAAIEAGRYRPCVAGTFKLDETAKAHEAQESGGTVGKLLIGV